MFFINRKGEKIITIRELFRTKQFIGGVDCKFLFYDLENKENEFWDFVEHLGEEIPLNTAIEEMREIVETCGWCRKLSKNEIDKNERLKELLTKHNDPRYTKENRINTNKIAKCYHRIINLGFIRKRFKK